MKRLIAIFVVLLLLGVVIKTPIQLLVGKGQFGATTVYGASGTLFNGNIERIVMRNPQAGDHQVDKLSWSFKPLSLLLLQAAADVEFVYLGGKAKGAAGVSVTRKLHITDFEYSNDADEFAQAFAGGFVGLGGNAVIQVDKAVLDLKTAQFSDVKGFVQWQQAKSVYPVPVSLGNVFMDLSQDETTRLLKADITNQGGELLVTGNAIMNANRGYQIDAKIKPSATVSDTVKQMLKNGAQAGLKQQADGSYRLLKSGTLR